MFSYGRTSFPGKGSIFLKKQDPRIHILRYGVSGAHYIKKVSDQIRKYPGSLSIERVKLVRNRRRLFYHVLDIPESGSVY